MNEKDDDVTDANPPQLDELGCLGTEALGERAANLVEVEFGLFDVAAEDPAESRRLDDGQRSGQQVVIDVP